jgi:hypothetical protein
LIETLLEKTKAVVKTKLSRTTKSIKGTPIPFLQIPGTKNDAIRLKGETPRKMINDTKEEYLK